MIILNCKDGLGNQMFEYGFAKYLQKITGEEKIYINNFFFKNGKRRYSLRHFYLTETVVVLNKPLQCLATVYFVLRLLACYPKVAANWFFGKDRPRDEKTFAHSSSKGLYVHFNTFHLFEIKPAKTITKFIYGNYENYGYLTQVIGDLRKEFMVSEEMNAENKAMYDELLSCRSVCVHIRRGDYLNPRWAYLNVCSFEYYQKAMDEMQFRHPNSVFYIFSNTHDDIEWIKENYSFRQPVRYVDLGNSDYEEFRLMQACNHFIISNSTFSWWAAVLSNRDGKDVMVPDRWVSDAPTPGINYNETKDSRGMYLPGWIEIGTQS